MRHARWLAGGLILLGGFGALISVWLAIGLIWTGVAIGWFGSRSS